MAMHHNETRCTELLTCAQFFQRRLSLANGLKMIDFITVWNGMVWWDGLVWSNLPKYKRNVSSTIACMQVIIESFFFFSQLKRNYILFIPIEDPALLYVRG